MIAAGESPCRTGAHACPDLDAVRQVDAEAVTLRESARQQRVRRAIAPHFQLAEGVGAPLPLQRWRIGAGDEGEVEELEEVHRSRILYDAIGGGQSCFPIFGGPMLFLLDAGRR